jgi:hypothetical protein
MASSRYDLYCWACESGPKSAKIADGSSIFMIKSGKCCHLTCNDANLPNTTYLREHPASDYHNIKPMRIHCKECANQLGVLIWSSGKLRPSFQQNVVTFKNGEGKKMGSTQWKHKYAQVHNVIPIENLGISAYRAPEDAKFYILDHKAWEFVKNGELRIQRDAVAGSEQDFAWKLSNEGSFYEAKYIANENRLLPGCELETKPRENEDDEELTKTFSHMNLIETVNSRNPYRSAKPLPKKFSTTTKNPFSLLEDE